MEQNCLINFSLTAPSKTFLLGEYVALHGGPTLILNTFPRFELQVKTIKKQQPVICNGITKESPAGKFLLANAQQFRGYQLFFRDPHQEAGGFGASSAQFLSVWTLKKIIANETFPLSSDIHILLKTYQQLSWKENGEGLPPSGADVVAQSKGHICYFNRSQNQLKIMSWPFTDINYYLLHTGNKISTHQHLRELSNLDTRELAEIVLCTLKHLEKKHIENFIQAIKQYTNILQDQGLILQETKHILEHLKQRSEVLAAKGCGALGADVILVIVETKNHSVFLEWVRQTKLRLVIYGNNTSAGLKLETGG
jgi:mevalonate kinase